MNKGFPKQDKSKAYKMVYNQELKMPEIVVTDPDSFFPILIRDPEAGLRKILKTRKNHRIHMTGL